MAYSVPSAEIQEAVQRHSGVLVDRLEQAFEPLIDDSNGRAGARALGRYLKCVASALDIASGPVPQIAAIDMYVFVRLCGTTVRRYWIPDVLDERGDAVEQVFRTSEEEIGTVLERFLTPVERQDLEGIIAEWLARNPDQVYVESVRLCGLTEYFGRVSERAPRAQGLLSSVRSATQAADQALLFGERALFLAHRMPFLVRLQGRLAAREVTTDVIAAARGILRSWSRIGLGIAGRLATAVLAATKPGFGLGRWAGSAQPNP